MKLKAIISPLSTKEVKAVVLYTKEDLSQVTFFTAEGPRESIRERIKDKFPGIEIEETPETIP